MGETKYMVMGFYPWKSLDANGVPLSRPNNEPALCGFIPIFDTEDAARKFAGERHEVQALEVGLTE
jgi:hypothetical protein